MSAYTAKLPKAPLPEKVKKAELDELFTFLGKKKRNLRPNPCGSRDPLRADLGCGARTNLRSVWLANHAASRAECSPWQRKSNSLSTVTTIAN